MIYVCIFGNSPEWRTGDIWTGGSRASRKDTLMEFDGVLHIGGVLPNIHFATSS